MLANPWFLASAIFGLIGILQEMPKSEEKKPAALPAPKSGAGKTSPVTVNVHGTKVQSGGKGAKAKPSTEVPSQPSGASGDG